MQTTIHKIKPFIIFLWLVLLSHLLGMGVHGNPTILHENIPKGPLILKPADLSNVTRRVPKQGRRITDSLAFNRAEMQSLAKKKLSITKAYSGLNCAKSKIASAILNVALNTGEDYEYGKNNFSVAIKIKVTPSGKPPFTMLLEINNNKVEQLHQVDMATLVTQKGGFISFDIEEFDNIANTFIPEDLQLRITLIQKALIGPDNNFQLIPKTARKKSKNNNQYTFQWSNTCKLKFPNYQFQLLRLFNTSDNKALLSPQNLTAEVDWSKALTMETQSDETSLDLSIVEGTGYYIWRVRPIGNYYEAGISNPQNWGAWSQAPESGIIVQESDLIKETYALFYKQFDENINWIYSRSFTEGDLDSSNLDPQTRISEQIVFANGLHQIRQTQTHLETQDVIIASQTLQDFIGRNAFSSMSVPLKNQQSLGYESRFIKNTLDKPYSPSDFDTDKNYIDPAPVLDVSGNHFDYFSNNNSDDRIPSAGGYPFSRMRFYNDGTDRIKEVSYVGNIHRLKPNDAKTIKTYYDSVSEQEIIKLFGDEAPSANSVYKIITKDVNNAARVNYIAKEGKIIATCLAYTGGSQSLDTLPSLTTTDIESLITKDSSQWGDYGIQSSKTLFFPVPTDVELAYTLTADTIEDICRYREYCVTCDYFVEIIVQDNDNPQKPFFFEEIPLPATSCEQPTAFKWRKKLDLPEGSYTITRRIKSNTFDSFSKQTYLNKHLNFLEQHYQSLVDATLGSLLQSLDGVINPEPSAEPQSFDNKDIMINAEILFNTDKLKTVLDDLKIPKLYPVNTKIIEKDGNIIYDLGCGSIEVPVMPCPKTTICPDKYFNPPDFEGYFKEKWPNETDYLPDYASGDWNIMIFNMLSDSKAEYDCESLWQCWKTLVNNYKKLKTGLEKAISQSSSEAIPSGMAHKFDLADSFLDCAGRKIRAVSNNPITDSYTDPGYLSHAYACMEYSPGSSKECEGLFCGTQNKTCSFGPGKDDKGKPWSEKEEDKDWQKFYECVENNKNVDEKTNSSFSKTDFEDEIIQAQKVEKICESFCEKRRKSFEGALKELYSLKEMDLNEIPECWIEGLVENCKSDCKVNCTDGEDVLKLCVEPKEGNRIEKAMVWDFEIDFPQNWPDGCKPSNSETITCGIDPQSICFKWKKTDLKKDLHEFEYKTCEQINSEKIRTKILEQIEEFIKDKKEEFEKNFTLNCINPENINDKLVAGYKQGYYHYTLLYYDRAGNLIRTVSPLGTESDLSSNTRNAIPSYTQISDYTYNSLGQVVRQHSNDYGETRFYYDLKGRIRFSQNSQQLDEGKFSYTKYDSLGRIIETGESHVAGFEDPKNINNLEFPDDGFFKTVNVYSEKSAIQYLGNKTQRYVYNRLSSIYTDEDGKDDTLDDRITTYYSYDPHGNVEWIIQVLPDLDACYISYEYDLISDKPLLIKYNEGLVDQFFRRYRYDSDNRLTHVETSINGKIWEKDAVQYYYSHGSLKRLEIGEDKLQGIDYVYTLQGWLKSVNHASLEKTKDPGKDNLAQNPFASDVYGTMIGYYGSDFDKNNSPYTIESLSLNPQNFDDLYDGNITTLILNTALPSSVTNFEHSGLVAQQFRYDELYRLLKSSLKSKANGWTQQDDYQSSYEYDSNGNIISLRRSAHGSDPLMDDLTFNYTENTNQLNYVHDAVLATKFGIDIDLQNENNYLFDKIGNLIKDEAEEIAAVRWTPHGKIAEIIRTSSSKEPNIQFKYDAAGNRVLKKVIDPGDPENITTTYYIRDIDGSILSVYQRGPQQSLTDTDPVYTLVEQPIYGNSRIGRLKPDLSFRLSDRKADLKNVFIRSLGLKEYEFTDNLDNVRAVISDVKLSKLNSITKIPLSTSFTADIKQVKNYYPYGMEMPARCFSTSSTSYRYGFNGMEQDPEIHGVGNSYTTQFRQYDVKIGRWMSADPQFLKTQTIGKNTSLKLNPYLFSFGNPINFIDPDGKEPRESKESGPVVKEVTNIVGSAMRSRNVDWKWNFLEHDKVTIHPLKVTREVVKRITPEGSVADLYSGFLDYLYYPAKGLAKSGVVGFAVGNYYGSKSFSDAIDRYRNSKSQQTAKAPKIAKIAEAAEAARWRDKDIDAQSMYYFGRPAWQTPHVMKQLFREEEARRHKIRQQEQQKRLSEINTLINKLRTGGIDARRPEHKHLMKHPHPVVRATARMNYYSRRYGE